VVEDAVRYKGINIVDTGWGILAEDKDKIFDSFFRSRSEEYNIPGVGLGLTIAKAIIEDHNGKIRIESEFKKGTECKIIFPVDDVKKKILIVDDEMDFHILVNQLFELKGYETLNAMSGEQGLEILSTEVPNLILLDLMMPGMSGEEVLQKIREDSRTEKVPVVIITAEREYDPKKLKALGADDYISKPFSGDVLLDVLNRFFYKE
jgi:CheY-like chemotaxis protein